MQNKMEGIRDHDELIKRLLNNGQGDARLAYEKIHQQVIGWINMM